MLPSLGDGNAELEFRPFLCLMSDAVLYSKLAADPTIERQYRASHAKCSLLMAVFAVEGALNSALLAQVSSNRLYRRIERFPFAEKVEFIATTYQAQQRWKSDAGWFLDMCELVDVRNQQVHPKNKRTKLVGSKDVTGHPHYKTPEPEFSHRLKIPIATGDWDSGMAATSIRAADKFLEGLFVEVCQFSDDQSSSVFVSRMEGEGWKLSVHEQHAEQQLVASMDSLNIRLQYMPKAFLSRT